MAVGFRCFDSRHAALQSKATRGGLRICKRFDSEQCRRIPARTKTRPNPVTNGCCRGLYFFDLMEEITEEEFETIKARGWNREDA